jgi:hypothetical protein
MKASLLDQLAALAADYRSKAAAIDQTLAILREQALVTKQARSQTVLAKAITLDTQRVNGTRATLLLSDGKKKKRGKQASNGNQIARRQGTAEFLNLFSTTEPRLPDHPRAQKNGGLSKLVDHGYLKRAGDRLYVRTEKPFVVKSWAKSDAPPTHITDRDARQSIQRVLWKFHQTKPRTVNPKRPGLLPWLVQTGYLTEKNGGYVRTGKDFSLNGRE